MTGGRFLCLETQEPNRSLVFISKPRASGNEGKSREFVIEKLTPYVDFITVDRYGRNLLAEKKYKTGHGPMILLNAHLDIVEELESS